ncbi:MAG: aminopeptidase, partial [Chloroflexi bacterium]|nr:aminopeptidase [Chloroflexota bacterium]
MTDPRVSKLAKVLVHYSVALKRGEQVVIRTSPLADELTLAVYEEVVKAGAFPYVMNEVPGLEETFFKYASNAQLDYVSPIRKMINQTFDASITIWTEFNTRNLSGADPKRIARSRKAGAPLTKTFLKRAAKGELKWTLTAYPNNAMAQEADMSLADYADFVFAAGMLNLTDPVTFWRKEAAKQQKLIKWLKGGNKAVLKGSNVDISLSIKGRTFIECAGKENFPDGEIFTGPVEHSVNGW